VLIDQAIKVAFGQVRPRIFECNLLGEGIGVRRVLKQRVHDALSSSLKIGERHDLMQESDSKRLGCIKALARECITAHLPHADRVIQLRNDDARHHAPAGFGDGEPGVVGADHDVT